MEPASQEFYTKHDLLSRAEEYRQRAGSTRTADIHDALLKLAQLYDEAADHLQHTTEGQLELSEVTSLKLLRATLHPT